MTKLESACAKRRAINLAGVDADFLGNMERAVGSAAMTKFFAKFGEATSESTVRTGGSGGSADGFLTPASASAQKGQLLKDPDFMRRVNSGDANAKGQLDRLQRIEAGMSA